MAAANPLWGAERVRGELLKLDIRVATSTIQRYLRGARPPRRAGQPWATFLRNHAPDIWACDFLPVLAAMLIQMPLVTRLRSAAAQPVRVGLAELAAPLADRRVRHDDPALGQQLLDIPVAQGEAIVAPHGVHDDRSREAITGVRWGRVSFLHAASSACRRPTPPS